MISRAQADDLCRDHDGPDPPLFADGYDECILGVTTTDAPNGRVNVVYSVAAIYERLLAEARAVTISDEAAARRQALDHLFYNVLGTYAGPGTPIYVLEGPL